MIINTYNGGTCYNRNKFMFCLIPREESLGFIGILNYNKCNNNTNRKDNTIFNYNSYLFN